jgi:hypothetical protein
MTIGKEFRTISKFLNRSTKHNGSVASSNMLLAADLFFCFDCHNPNTFCGRYLELDKSPIVCYISIVLVSWVTS